MTRAPLFHKFRVSGTRCLGAAAAQAGPNKMGAGVSTSPHCSLRFGLSPARVSGRVVRDPVPAPGLAALPRSRSGSSMRQAASLHPFALPSCPKAGRSRWTAGGKWDRLRLSPLPRASSFSRPAYRVSLRLFLRRSAAPRLEAASGSLPFPVSGKGAAHRLHLKTAPWTRFGQAKSPVDKKDNGDGMGLRNCPTRLPTSSVRAEPVEALSLFLPRQERRTGLRQAQPERD
jgi:hypothetical protein